MTQLTFPAVTGLTPFEQQNLTSSIATFERALTQEEMGALKAAMERFYIGRPVNARTAVFYPEFPFSRESGTDGKLRGNDTMQLRVYSRYEMPTRPLFDGLLAYLTEALQITFPELPAGRPDQPVYSPPIRDEEPEAPRRFVPRGGRTFRPGEQHY